MEVTHANARSLPFELLGPRRVVGNLYDRKFDGEIKLAPAGFDGKFCFACQRYLTPEQSNAFANEASACPNCSQSAHWAEFSVDLREDQLPLLDEREVVRRRWYHVSQRANWDEQVKASGIFVHLGSQEAALARFDHLRLLGESDMSLPHYLHVVLLRMSAKVAPGIYHDQVSRWPKDRFDHTSFGGVSMLQVDVLRYLNEYEGAGTVSLLADPQAFALVGASRLEPQAN